MPKTITKYQAIWNLLFQAGDMREVEAEPIASSIKLSSSDRTLLSIPCCACQRRTRLR